MSVLAIARLPVVCAVLAALVALLALMGTQVHALEIAVDAQAQVCRLTVYCHIERLKFTGLSRSMRFQLILSHRLRTATDAFALATSFPHL